MHLNKTSLVQIKKIAARLPNVPYHTYTKSKVPTKKWVVILSTWLFTRRWPNGEFVFSGGFVQWVNIKFMGANKHDVNHNRRMKRRYKSDGAEGVYKYLSGLGVHPDLLKYWTKDLV